LSNRQQAIRVLSEWDRRGRYVFTLHDLAKLFPSDKPKTLKEGVNRLVRDGLLKRACRGLESALSEYGAISQFPIDRLNIRDIKRPLRLAIPQAAWRDLKRVGRNTHSETLPVLF